MSSLVKKIKKLPVYLASLKPIPLKEADHDYCNVFLKSKKDLEQLLSIPLNKASILIIGCGYRYAEVILYSSIIKNVYGLDNEGIFYRDGIKSLYYYLRSKDNDVFLSLYDTYLKRNGLQKYYKRLYVLSNYKVNHEELNLTSYDGGKIPFENAINAYCLSSENVMLEEFKQA